MSEAESIVYRYDPGPDTFLEEGVTTGWVVLQEGVGPARVLKVAALTDGEGVAVFVPDGEWQATEVVDDTAGPTRT